MRSGPTTMNQPQTLNDDYIRQLKQLMNSNYATQYIAQIMAQNPQLNSIMQLIQNGNNPRVIFENLARQRGIDPNEVLNKLLN